MPKIHQVYNEAFRQQAVDLLLSSGRPLKRVAAELGVTANSLRAWRDPNELKRLRREVEFLRRQRDILRKSAEHPGRGPAAGYTLIDTMRDHYSICELCTALGLSRSGYHSWKRRQPGPRALANERLLGPIRQIHAHRHTCAYGSPRMTAELRARGHGCSRGRIARLMRSQGIRALYQSEFLVCTFPVLCSQGLLICVP